MKKLFVVSLITAAFSLTSASASAHVPHRCQHIDGPVKKQICINKWHRGHHVHVAHDHRYRHDHHNHHAKVNAKIVVRVPIRF